MDEDDLISVGFDHHQRTVVVERRGGGHHVLSLDLVTVVADASPRRAVVLGADRGRWV
jgi:hypothetical protein